MQNNSSCISRINEKYESQNATVAERKIALYIRENMDKALHCTLLELAEQISDLDVVLVPVGVIYIAETMSDILKVGYFKLTHGKRIFKMAPIHHHFEMCGWSENKIVTIFTAVSTLFCALALFGVMNRMV